VGGEVSGSSETFSKTGGRPLLATAGLCKEKANLAQLDEGFFTARWKDKGTYHLT